MLKTIADGFELSLSPGIAISLALRNAGHSSHCLGQSATGKPHESPANATGEPGISCSPLDDAA